MGGRCARVDGEFLALVDFKGSELVVKLQSAGLAVGFCCRRVLIERSGWVHDGLRWGPFTE
jgi:hypothetical protein